jgi:hypothetical protein
VTFDDIDDSIFSPCAGFDISEPLWDVSRLRLSFLFSQNSPSGSRTGMGLFFNKERSEIRFPFFGSRVEN